MYVCVFFFFNCSHCYKSQQVHLSLSYALGYDIKSLGSLAEAQHLFIVFMVSIRKATGYSGKLIERRALKSGVGAIDWTFSIFGGFVSFVISLVTRQTYAFQMQTRARGHGKTQ